MTDCAKIGPKLHELMDGLLSSEEERAVRSHSSSCASCGGERRLLERVVKAVEALPVIGARAGFNARLMGSLGFVPAPDPVPLWLTRAAGALAAVAAGWAAVLALGFLWGAQSGTFSDLWASLPAAADVPAALQLLLVKVSMTAADSLRIAAKVLPAIGLALGRGGLVFPLAASAVLAGGTLTFLSKPVHAGNGG